MNDLIFGFVQKMDSKKGDRRPVRIVLMRRSVIMDEWELPEKPGDETVIQAISEGIRERAGEEAIALTGRIVMRMEGITRNGTCVGTQQYVLLGQSRGEETDIDDDSPATTAAALSASQRHVERFASIAGNALLQASEAQQQVIHGMKSQLAMYQERESKIMEERFLLIDKMAEFIIDKAKSEAAALIETSADKRKEELFGTAKMLGTALIARVSGSPDMQASAIGGILASMTDEQKMQMMSILNDEQRAAVAMAMSATQAPAS